MQDSEHVTCRPLLDPARGCKHTLPRERESLIGEDIFHIGLIADLTSRGKEAPYGLGTTRAIELALELINTSAGVPVEGRPARKLLAIVCDESELSRPTELADGPEPLRSAVDHLVHRLQVPVILGGSKSGATRKLHREYLDGFDTLVLSPSATDDTLTDIWRRDSTGVERQLFWRTVPPNSLAAASMKTVQRYVAQHASGLTDDAEAADVVSVFDPENTANEDFQNLLREDPNYLSNAYSFRAGDGESSDETVRRLLDRAPRFVLAVGTGEFVTPRDGEGREAQSMLAELEKQWPESTHPRPWYIFGEGSRAADFSTASSLDTRLADRVIGSAPGARSSPLSGAFETAFQTYFEHRSDLADADAVTPGNLAECGFDAAFLLAYATTQASFGGVWPRGAELAQAIGTLDCKDESTHMLQAAKLDYAWQAKTVARSPHACFDFEGVSGALDFGESSRSKHVPKSREPSADFALWCLRRPGKRGDQTANLTGYYYRISSDAVVAVDGRAALSFEDGWCDRAFK